MGSAQTLFGCHKPLSLTVTDRHLCAQSTWRQGLGFCASARSGVIGLDWKLALCRQRCCKISYTCPVYLPRFILDIRGCFPFQRGVSQAAQMHTAADASGVFPWKAITVLLSLGRVLMRCSAECTQELTSCFFKWWTERTSLLLKYVWRSSSCPLKIAWKLQEGEMERILFVSHHMKLENWKNLILCLFNKTLV